MNTPNKVSRLEYMRTRFKQLESKIFYQEVASAEATVLLEEEDAEKAAMNDRGIPNEPEEVLIGETDSQ